jgi:hypothetical protein
MTKTTKWLVGAAVATVLAGGVGGVAVASGGGDGGERGDGHPITGDAYDKATAKALETTGGGRVTETEAGDEESYYQVEVTLDDGSQVDVNLDEQFNVVATKHEREREGVDDDAGSAEG